MRARWYDPAIGRFISPDPTDGAQAEPLTQNAYLYANGDPVSGVDHLGLQTTGDLLAAENSAGVQSSSATSLVARPIFKKFACEIGEAVAMETITYGIYVLSDGVSFYVGHSVDIERRFAEHLRGILKVMSGRWEIVERFAVMALGPEGKQASRDLLRIAEQTVMTAFGNSGKTLINRRNAIDMLNGRLRDAFARYGKNLCK